MVPHVDRTGHILLYVYVRDALQKCIQNRDLSPSGKLSSELRRIVIW